MKEHNIASTPLTVNIEPAFERLVEYLQSINIFDALVHLDDSTAVVKFNPEEILPTPEQILKILKIFFWDGKLEIDNLQNLATIDLSKHTLVINLKCKAHIANVVNTIRGWHLEVQNVNISSTQEFSVYYIVTGRGPIDYEGLEQIRNMVDPERVNKRSVIVFGDGNLYDMRVRPTI